MPLKKRTKVAIAIVAGVIFSALAFHLAAVLLYLRNGAGLDDGPFTGVACSVDMPGQPSSSLRLNGRLTLEAYNRKGQEPVLVMRDAAGKQLWCRALDVRNQKKYATCRVSEVALHSSQAGRFGYLVVGSVDWTYGRERATFHFTREGRLERFYLSW